MTMFLKHLLYHLSRTWKRCRYQDWYNSYVAWVFFTGGCFMAAISWIYGASWIFVPLFVILGIAGAFITSCGASKALSERNEEALPFISFENHKFFSNELTEKENLKKFKSNLDSYEEKGRHLERNYHGYQTEFLKDGQLSTHGQSVEKLDIHSKDSVECIEFKSDRRSTLYYEQYVTGPGPAGKKSQKADEERQATNQSRRQLAPHREIIRSSQIEFQLPQAQTAQREHRRAISEGSPRVTDDPWGAAFERSGRGHQRTEFNPPQAQIPRRVCRRTISEGSFHFTKDSVFERPVTDGHQRKDIIVKGNQDQTETDCQHSASYNFPQRTYINVNPLRGPTQDVSQDGRKYKMKCSAGHFIPQRQYENVRSCTQSRQETETYDPENFGHCSPSKTETAPTREERISLSPEKQYEEMGTPTTGGPSTQGKVSKMISHSMLGRFFPLRSESHCVNVSESPEQKIQDTEFRDESELHHRNPSKTGSCTENTRAGESLSPDENYERLRMLAVRDIRLPEKESKRTSRSCFGRRSISEEYYTKSSKSPEKEKPNLEVRDAATNFESCSPSKVDLPAATCTESKGPLSREKHSVRSKTDRDVRRRQKDNKRSNPSGGASFTSSGSERPPCVPPKEKKRQYSGSRNTLADTDLKIPTKAESAVTIKGIEVSTKKDFDRKRIPSRDDPLNILKDNQTKSQAMHFVQLRTEKPCVNIHSCERQRELTDVRASVLDPEHNRLLKAEGYSVRTEDDRIYKNVPQKVSQQNLLPLPRKERKITKSEAHNISIKHGNQECIARGEFNPCARGISNEMYFDVTKSGIKPPTAVSSRGFSNEIYFDVAKSGTKSPTAISSTQMKDTFNTEAEWSDSGSDDSTVFEQQSEAEPSSSGAETAGQSRTRVEGGKPRSEYMYVTEIGPPQRTYTKPRAVDTQSGKSESYFPPLIKWEHVNPLESKESSVGTEIKSSQFEGPYTRTRCPGNFPLAENLTHLEHASVTAVFPSHISLNPHSSLVQSNQLATCHTQVKFGEVDRGHSGDVEQKPYVSEGYQRKGKDIEGDSQVEEEYPIRTRSKNVNVTDIGFLKETSINPGPSQVQCTESTKVNVIGETNEYDNQLYGIYVASPEKQRLGAEKIAQSCAGTKKDTFVETFGSYVEGSTKILSQSLTLGSEIIHSAERSIPTPDSQFNDPLESAEIVRKKQTEIPRNQQEESEMERNVGLRPDPCSFSDSVTNRSKTECTTEKEGNQNIPLQQEDIYLNTAKEHAASSFLPKNITKCVPVCDSSNTISELKTPIPPEYENVKSTDVKSLITPPPQEYIPVYSESIPIPSPKHHSYPLGHRSIIDPESSYLRDMHTYGIKAMDFTTTNQPPLEKCPSNVLPPMETPQSSQSISPTKPYISRHSPLKIKFPFEISQSLPLVSEPSNQASTSTRTLPASKNIDIPVIWNRSTLLSTRRGSLSEDKQKSLVSTQLIPSSSANSPIPITEQRSKSTESTNVSCDNINKSPTATQSPIHPLPTSTMRILSQPIQQSPEACERQLQTVSTERKSNRRASFTLPDTPLTLSRKSVPAEPPERSHHPDDKEYQ